MKRYLNVKLTLLTIICLTGLVSSEQLNLVIESSKTFEVEGGWYLEGVKEGKDCVDLWGEHVVIRLDREGNKLWQKNYLDCRIVDLAVDEEDNLYVLINYEYYDRYPSVIKKYSRDGYLIKEENIPLLFKEPEGFPYHVWDIEINGEYYFIGEARSIIYDAGDLICLFDTEVAFDDWEKLIEGYEKGELVYLGLSSRGVGLIRYSKDLNLKSQPEIVVDSKYVMINNLVCPINEYGGGISLDALGNLYVSGYRWIIMEDDYFIKNLNNGLEITIPSILEDYEHYIEIEGMKRSGGLIAGFNADVSGYIINWDVVRLSSDLATIWEERNLFWREGGIDSKDNLWCGFNEEPDLTAKIIKVEGSTGKILGEYRYPYEGLFDLFWVDKEDRINVISCIEEGKWLLTTFKEASTTDTQPPAKITDLAVYECSVTSGSITLSCTAVGDDGNQGRATTYDIRYSENPILTDDDFEKATKIQNPPQPKPAGKKETCTIDGLKQATLYYFAIKAVDEVGNRSELSNVVSQRTLLDVPDIKQFDVRWSTHPYLNGPNTIGAVGCALTSLAMVINYYADYHPLDDMRTKIVKRNPKELNDFIVEKGWYDVDTNDIYFKEVSKITNHAVVYGGRRYERNDIKLNEELENKRPTILLVNYLHPIKGLRRHYVVAVGSCTTTYKINDPGHIDVKTLKDEFVVPETDTPTSYKNNYIDVIRFKPGPTDESALFIDGWRP